jgi:TonB family protein
LPQQRQYHINIHIISNLRDDKGTVTSLEILPRLISDWPCPCHPSPRPSAIPKTPSPGRYGGLSMSGDKNHGKLARGLTCGLLCLLCTGTLLSQDATTRKILKRVAAQYPAVLKQRGIGGVVKLRVFVNANGTVRDSSIIGGNPILANCAQKAVKQWLFAPDSTDSEVEVSIVFDPNSQTQ